jgi:hypothetical protein
MPRKRSSQRLEPAQPAAPVTLAPIDPVTLTVPRKREWYTDPNEVRNCAK